MNGALCSSPVQLTELITMFKTDIPQTLMIDAFQQVSNYLHATNWYKDLPGLDQEEYKAGALFGGEGAWSEEDTVVVNTKLSVLAANVAVQIFRIQRGAAAQFEGLPKIENPPEMTDSVFGFGELFRANAPELL